MTGRINTIDATARIDEGTGQYVYSGLGIQRGRMDDMGFHAQDSWRVRPDLTLNFGLRYELQMPFQALNASYSMSTLDDVWGISGNVAGLQPERRDAGDLQPVQAGCHARATCRSSCNSAKASTRTRPT